MKSPIVILAASKGRQFSEEDKTLGGGVFTQTLAELITRRRNQGTKTAPHARQMPRYPAP